MLRNKLVTVVVLALFSGACGDDDGSSNNQNQNQNENQNQNQNNDLCGNAELDTGETCDDGADNGTYSYCNATCDGQAAHCGDGDIESGEETCDDGADNGTYGHCNATCSGDGPHCGDDTVDVGEEVCDDGADNGTYGHCNATCDGTAAHCGDGDVDAGDELCDDGVNNGAYGFCNTTCDASAAHCGDENVDAGEEFCDDGVNNGAYGFCNTTCDASAAHCGDENVDAGEEFCDDGVNNGTWSHCNTTCDAVLTCGDGIVTSPEACEAASVPDCTTLGFDGGTTSCAADCLSVSTSWCTFTNYRFVGEDPEGDLTSTGLDLKRLDYRLFAGSLRFRVALWQPWTTLVNHRIFVTLAQPDGKALMEFGLGNDGNPSFRTWDETNGWQTPGSVPGTLVIDDTAAATEGVLTFQIHPNAAPGVVDLTSQRGLVWAGTMLPAFGWLEDSLFDDIWYPIDWTEQERYCGIQGATFPEPCDGADFNGMTCESFGFQSGGTLSCDSCSNIDLSSCTEHTDWTSLGTDPAGDNTAGQLDITNVAYRWEGNVLYFQVEPGAPFDPLAEDIHLVLHDPRGDAFRLEWKHGVTYAATRAGTGDWTPVAVPAGDFANAWAGLDGNWLIFAVDVTTLPGLMDVAPEALRVHVASYNDRSTELSDSFPDDLSDIWSLPLINWGSGEYCGNGIIEGAEACDAGNVTGTQCPAAGVPYCDNSCVIDMSPCNPGTCTRWTLVSLDPADDSQEAAAEYGALEYRVDPKLEWIELRVSAFAALDLTDYEVTFLVQNSTGGEWASLILMGAGPTLEYRDNGGAVNPLPSTTNMTGTDLASGELLVHIALDDLADAVPSVADGKANIEVWVENTNTSVFVDLVATPAVSVDWTDRETCWFSADGNPDALGDPSGAQDVAALSYNAAGTDIKVAFDFHTAVDLSTAHFEYIFHNFSKGKNYHLGIYNGALYLEYEDGGMTSVAPPSCTTVPASIASGSVSHVEITCAKADLETALVAHNFQFLDDDFYFIGAQTFLTGSQDDKLPEDWTGNYWTMDPAVVP